MSNEFWEWVNPQSTHSPYLRNVLFVVRSVVMLVPGAADVVTVAAAGGDAVVAKTERHYAAIDATTTKKSDPFNKNSNLSLFTEFSFGDEISISFFLFFTSLDCLRTKGELFFLTI